ncbi:hypothetical protein BC828DRAFT_394049 [Blastocladiella britannica]|nr:hypothetical protein BC828DRAFT_394049 [Blastocladiella britannica]
MVPEPKSDDDEEEESSEESEESSASSSPAPAEEAEAEVAPPAPVVEALTEVQVKAKSNSITAALWATKIAAEFVLDLAAFRDHHAAIVTAAVASAIFDKKVPEGVLLGKALAQAITDNVLTADELLATLNELEVFEMWEDTKMDSPTADKIATALLQELVANSNGAVEPAGLTKIFEWTGIAL